MWKSRLTMKKKFNFKELNVLELWISIRTFVVKNLSDKHFNVITGVFDTKNILDKITTQNQRNEALKIKINEKITMVEIHKDSIVCEIKKIFLIFR